MNIYKRRNIKPKKIDINKDYTDQFKEKGDENYLNDETLKNDKKIILNATKKKMRYNH